ncbi:MAG: hypothetical protein GC192_16180 [Bacteroidetes bacterium]|nr:hypothetical protein [Bacteroidota bacterium]
MKYRILLILFVFSTTLLTAQSYITAGGIRLGTEWGLTFKQRVLEHTTIEGILQQSFQRKEFTITGLAAKHYPVLFNGLNFYFGGGLHKGWNNQAATTENPNGFKNPFGITGIGGLELSIGRLNLSYDYKPALNLVGGEKTFYMQTGLSARYIFYSNRDLKKKQKAQKKAARKQKIRDFFKLGKKN